MTSKESPSVVRDRARRMKWWREARYGMFIHYGLYSVIGRGESVFNRERMSWSEYNRAIPGFKPRLDACARWASLAKKGGMKYMVFTTRHGDGFSLWDTKGTNYNSVKLGPKRDLVAEYVKACRKAGLRVGLYYCLMDWHHPDSSRCDHNEPARKRYTQYLQAGLRELMTNYGKIDVLWYDTPWPMQTPEKWDSKRMNAMVRSLQPDIVINNRSLLPEDFDTPEQTIHPSAPGRPWESCMTFTGYWGWRPDPDEDWAGPREIIQRLRQVAIGHGNLLQNIGPKADGSIPKIGEECFLKVGRWLKKNGEAVYRATDPIKKLPKWLMNGRWTLNGRVAYFWYPVWMGAECVIGGLNAKVKRVTLLATGRTVRFKQSKDRLVLTGLPAKCPDRVTQLVIFRIEFASPLRQEPTTGYRVI